jgi:radical SAM superfamily enzyme YgiQ (UPF0313 family)
MKITLVFPPFYLQSLYNLPPLGLLNLATLLREGGHQVNVLDLVLALRLKTLKASSAIYEDAARMILRHDPDLVGFSVQCATFPAVVQIAQRLKRARPGIRIVAGGHDVTFVAEQTLERFPWIDAVVRGEGELSLPELVSAWTVRGDGEGIEGISWRRGTEVVRNPDRQLICDLDVLPLPDYGFVPDLETYRDACGIPRAIAILEVGRGCPHACVYCSESIMWRRRTRTFSIPRITHEMRRLREEYGAQCFLLAYDQFTADRRFVEEFCRRVLEERLNDTPWYCISRLDSMDVELLRLMREAGCESMCYGIDSGSRRTLAFIGKQIDETILYQRVRETTDEGMVPTLSFVIGFPEEQREDVDQTLTLALRAGIQGNCNPLIQLPTVLPGTELHRRYVDCLVREADSYFSLGLEFHDARRLEDDSRLIQSDPFLFSGFYNLPCAGLGLDELDRLSRFFPLLVNLYPKTFLLLAMALGESPSRLFSRLLGYVAVAEARALLSLTPEECRCHVPSFCGEALAEASDGGSWGHLPEIVLYETQSLETALFPLNRATATADLCRLAEMLPRRDRGVVVREFAHNLPCIVDDLKEGIFRESYPLEPTLLVFSAGESGVEVTQINEFGRDLLELCDGSARLEEIARDLYQRYGSGMESEGFMDECREAMDTLREMELVRLPS